MKVDESEKMQKDVYLSLCQRFISLLGDHLARCDQQGSDYESPWFHSTLDNFRQLLVKVCVCVSLTGSEIQWILPIIIIVSTYIPILPLH